MICWGEDRGERVLCGRGFTAGVAGVETIPEVVLDAGTVLAGVEGAAAREAGDGVAGFLAILYMREAKRTV